MKAEDCLHLTVPIVEEIHTKAIARFGGSDGMRDYGLLESAVLTPQSSFGGESPFNDIVEVAAAYLFYLCKNHPFIDGNKRVALGACLVFLQLSGIQPPDDSKDWEDMTLAVADGSLTTKKLRELLGT